MKKSTYIYRRFERFWHWSQALLIFFLALTGFEAHSSYNFFGFKNAVNWHNIAAWAFLILIIFAIFWHFVTGEWKQYIPTTKYMKAQINYYIFGIFKGAPHPTHKTIYNKFNPLQRFTYLGLKLIVIPVQVISGFLFLYYMSPNTVLNGGGLNIVAVIHTLGAFLLIVFIIIHVYLTTTGETPLTSIKAMLTGWELIHTNEDEENNKQLKNAVQKSVAGYYRINTLGYFEDVNAAWLSLYGYNKDEIIGKHYSLAREKNDVKKLDEVVFNVLQGNTLSNMMAIRKCKDGSLRKHILSANPVYKKDEISGMEGFILDLDTE